MTEILYHGSGVLVEELEPRLAKDTMFKEGCQKAVYATTDKNMALSFALGGIPDDNGNLERIMLSEYGSKMIFRKGTPNYGGKGYLYIIAKENFIHVMGTQWVCYEKVKPIDVIEIDVNDYLELCVVEQFSNDIKE